MTLRMVLFCLGLAVLTSVVGRLIEVLVHGHW